MQTIYLILTQSGTRIVVPLTGARSEIVYAIFLFNVD
jgi:hypothetical protein